MGVSQIRKYCFEGQQQQQRPNHYKIIVSDYKSFEQQRWYTFQNPILFDPNKFIFLYPNYQQEQKSLLNRWRATIDIKTIEYGQSRNQEDVMSTRWKYAIKRGVPIEYFKVIVSVIFNKNFNGAKHLYQKLKVQINLSEPVPLFGSQQSTLKQAVHSPFLNAKGFQVLKELMYLYKKKKGQIFHNKYIGHITAILLIFFEDYQVYDLVSTLMEQSSNMSQNRQESYRWHMVFKEDQMKNLANLFYVIVGKNSNTVLELEKAFVKNNIDKIKLFQKVVDNFFYGFLPFSFILRIFILYLNEGVKMFFRIFYAIIVYCEPELLKATSLDRALLILKKKCLRISSEQSISMLKKSFNLNLKATISTALIESRLKKQQSQRKYYFLPFIRGVSNILSYDDLEIIWGYLPFELKSYDLQLLFPMGDQESATPKTLKDLLKSFGESNYNLIIIKTTTNSVFGCFFVGKPRVQESHIWYGSKENFVFSLNPKKVKYPSQRQNNQYLLTAKDCFKVGFGGSGSAIVIKENLKQGQTQKCNTFRNEPLNNDIQGPFQILYIQAFSLY